MPMPRQLARRAGQRQRRARRPQTCLSPPLPSSLAAATRRPVRGNYRVDRHYSWRPPAKVVARRAVHFLPFCGVMVSHTPSTQQMLAGKPDISSFRPVVRGSKRTNMLRRFFASPRPVSKARSAFLSLHELSPWGDIVHLPSSPSTRLGCFRCWAVIKKSCVCMWS